MQDLTWQPALESSVELDWGAPVTRHQLDDATWVDHSPTWLRGSADLFAELVEAVPWQQTRRIMYDRHVDVPRLWAMLPVDSAPLPPELPAMAAELSKQYGKDLDHVGLNLYRDGRDSVAWHADRIGRHERNPLVALLSLGARRPFLLRPGRPGAPVSAAGVGAAAGQGTARFLLGQGDLLVMGGACQHRWLHAVPKVASAGPRVSIGFRHGRVDPS
jgi:alkylated DNA repair dioxygenase AlkB